MIGRQVKICTGFTQSIQILRRKKIKKIYCPMTDTAHNAVPAILHDDTAGKFYSPKAKK